MSLSAQLRLRGRLEQGPYGLVLRPAGGGVWELETRRSARRLVGREVEVIGHRAEFNGLICDQVWLARQARPRSSKINIEYLLVAGLVGYGLIAALANLVGHLR